MVKKMFSTASSNKNREIDLNLFAWPLNLPHRAKYIETDNHKHSNRSVYKLCRFLAIPYAPISFSRYMLSAIRNGPYL